MKLAVGTRLGPYEIHQPIGAGGMGVVYKADDSRLGRKVAIKILPQAHGDHLKRFEREARTIGGLNHPNLLTLFDIGDHEGSPYLVTELLEGESLRVRLARVKRLPLRQAMQVAAEVARGLAAAHGAGVIHRDIKPDNIFLTTDGRLKILDFGIAKLLPPEISERISKPDFAHDPTLDPSMTPTANTETGVMIGTPGYMAPEQLDGSSVDERADIFALGVVFYEMIAGERAFKAPSPIEESYAILKQTPEPPPGATPAVARIVLRCLEKRPEARFQSATDLAFALDELDASTDPVSRISASDLVTSPQQRPAGVLRRRRRWIALAAALVLVAAAAGTAGLLAGRAMTKPPAVVTATWPSLVEGGPEYQRVTFHSQTRWHARLAPDGKSALYSMRRDGREQVMRSLLAQPSILPMNINGRLLDVSARGELAVVVEPFDGAGGTLARAFEGAGPRALADRVTDAAWMDDDSLAIIRDGAALEFPIGTSLRRNETGKLDLLCASPRGDLMAFVDHPASADTRGRVIIVDRTGKELAASAEETGIEGVSWSVDGNEAWYSHGATITALDRKGHQRVVLRGSLARLVLSDVNAGKILVAPSDVRLKMFTGKRGGPYREVSLFDSSEVTGTAADGSALAFVEAAGTGLTAEGYAYFLRRGDQPPALVAQAFQLALLPDASAAIAVTGPTKLSRIPTGVGSPTSLGLGPITTIDIGDAIAVSWNGRHIVVRGAAAGGPMKLWRFDLAQPTAPPLPIDAHHEGGRHPISPDGATIAISRNEGGVDLVSLGGAAARSFEGPSGEQPVSFSGDGTALFVLHERDDVLEVDRIELANGARTSWVKIVPEQRPIYYAVSLDATGDLVTYSTNSDSSDLYVIEPPAAH
jgi:hypothetical protein